jgi:hypothetical protein
VRKWQPIETLNYDGRQVEFLNSFGIKFEALATHPRQLSKAERFAIFKSDGAWPDVKHNPTYFREIEN